METLFTVGSFIAYLSPTHVLVFAFAILIVLLGALLVVQTRNNARLHDLTYPVYDHAVKEAEQKANHIIEQAQEKAREMLLSAESEAAKIIGDREHSTEKVMREFEKRLAELVHKNEVAFEAYSQQAVHAFEELGTRMKSQAEASGEALSKEFSGLAEGAGALRLKLEEDVKKRVGEGLEQELRTVRDAIKTFQDERMKFINDNLVTLIEKTTALVLHRQLSMAEHADVIYKSFEEAKRDGVLG